MGRKVDSRAVRAAIESAFKTVPYPGDDHLVYDARYPDVAATREAFKGRSWRALDVGFLRVNVEALSFLSPEGLRYYLPAFMSVSMLQPKKADVIPLFVCLTLTPPKTGDENFREFKRRTAVFDSAQRNAIKAYLIYAQEHLGIEAAAHALHRFWDQTGTCNDGS